MGFAGTARTESRYRSSLGKYKFALVGKIDSARLFCISGGYGIDFAFMAHIASGQGKALAEYDYPLANFILANLHHCCFRYISLHID